MLPSAFHQLDAVRHDTLYELRGDCAMGFKLVMLPPQTDGYRAWGKRLAADVPEVNVVVAEGEQQAQHDIVDADAAFGILPADLLQRATKLRWLQCHAAAPPAGYYYPELIAH